MVLADPLFESFCTALNDELETIACEWRIDPVPPPIKGTMWLLSSTGARLGCIPDHTDAATLASFVVIFENAKLGL